MKTLTKGVDRVYLASPLATYFTPRYDRTLTHAQQHFLGAEIIAARGLYATTQEWQRAWPLLVPTLTALVFFTDPQRWIGYGVWTEIKDAMHQGLSISWLTDNGLLHDWKAVQLSVPNEQDWRQYLRVSLRASVAVSP